MTREQLDEIKKLAEAATPGPWATGVDELVNLRDEFHADSGVHQVALHDCFCEQDAEKNAAFITAMREHALPLVEALEEAWKERDEARAEIERLREVVKNSFTLEQITETMLKAIDETTRDPTPMPRRPRRLETKEGAG